MITFPSYYLSCYWLMGGRTFGKISAGIQVVPNKFTILKKRQLLIREIVCKYIMIFVIPVFLFGQCWIFKYSLFDTDNCFDNL